MQKVGNFHHGNLRVALLDAAREKLERDGHTKLSLRALAESIGVSCAAPFRHFSSKDALLKALGDDGRHEIALIYRRAIEMEAASSTRLREACRGHIEFALQHPQLYQLMFVDTAHWTEDAVPAEGRNNYEMFVRLVVEASAVPVGTPVAAACWSLIHGFALLHISGRLMLAGDPDVLKEATLDAVLHIITAP